MQTEVSNLAEYIRRAFARVLYPGDHLIHAAAPVDQPPEPVDRFRGRTDWRTIKPGCLDDAEVLHRFTPQAFRFFLPAFMLADLQGALQHADPLFALYYGLRDEDRDRVANPRVHGSRTWFQLKREFHSGFTRIEATAIVAFMRHQGPRRQWPEERRMVDQALRNFWLAKAGQA
jgi:hypothetical protein